jgi:hypothetical protein
MLALIDNACRGENHAPAEQELAIILRKKFDVAVSKSVYGANINISVMIRFAIMIMWIALLVFSDSV